MKLTTTKDLVEQSLQRILSNMESVTPQLNKAMSYAVLSGGKRLRPLFVLATTEALGGEVESALGPACAIEFVHTYSLIHDDLPAMDDDNLRHGVPSCHRVFGEDQAILAGDALQTLAFELLAKPEKFQVTNTSLVAEQQLAIVQCLANAIGVAGMAGGQSLDVQESTSVVTLQQLEKMHAAKTGALFEAALVIGGLVTGAREDTLTQLGTIGQKIGYAFQIVDDILDVTQSTETLGKPAASDADSGKITFVTLLGVEDSRKRADQQLNEIMELLKTLNIESGLLIDLAQQAIERDY